MLNNKEINSDGIIIILSYPDTVVRPAYWETLSSFWPKIGIGSNMLYKQDTLLYY